MDKALLIKLATTHANCDYSNSRSVRKANEAADKFRSLVAGANENELETAFELIHHPIAQSWFAFSVLDLAHPNLDQRQQCLHVIQALATGASPDAFGARVWLSQHAQNA
jgi:hypothetical protein